jgi:hypothetical protein
MRAATLLWIIVLFAYDIDPEFLLDLSDEPTGGLEYVQPCDMISIHSIFPRDLLGGDARY